jgi:muramoyltetrapeptide carboxypeptidase LdcA involved in peptidoglycan recycling
MRDHFTQTLDWFSRTLLANDPVRLEPARSWTDDLWFLDQDDRVARPGDGWWAMRPGAATGTVLGTNLCTLNLLQGTGYLPSLAGAVLMIEDDSRSDPPTFARDLTSLLQLPDAGTIRGLAIGRFQVDSGMTRPLLEAIVERQPVLNGLPVLANVDFGHTFPLATLPIGGTVELTVGERSSVLLSG